MSSGDCPVCGAEGMNCAGTAPPPAHILPIYEPEGPFEVQEHVYVQVPISAKRHTTLLKYHKGQRISLDAAREAGLLHD